MNDKNKIYILFEQLPKVNSGGLITAYRALIPILKKHYDVEIISVFSPKEENFECCKIHTISDFGADFDVAHFKDSFKSMEFKEAAKFPVTVFRYLLFPQKIRSSIRKLTKNGIIIAVSPAAARFVPKNLPYILEIHSSYQYFFDGPIIGRLQTRLMTKPALTLFRTKADSMKASSDIHPSFVYNFCSEQCIQQDDVSPKNRRILFVGRLEDLKDPLRVVDCAKSLEKLGVNFVLDIYGEGSLKASLLEYIHQSGLENKIYYKGYTNDKTIYRNYDLLWVTSKTEGFGLVIIEAKAQAIPTISTNWGEGVYEVIADKENGYICKTNEEFALVTRELFENPLKLTNMKLNALADFSRFSQKNAETDWMNIINYFQNEWF
ncbi:glycosyltransferase [Ileibacterium valens]|uniref:glycosyltransferase n=1 Tax=Ileibacterium valens TaxID=1862668 RepID=UPI0023551FA5|nr:glycosyltransferase [Ileibacterium valens]